MYSFNFLARAAGRPRCRTPRIRIREIERELLIQRPSPLSFFKKAAHLLFPLKAALKVLAAKKQPRFDHISANQVGRGSESSSPSDGSAFGFHPRVEIPPEHCRLVADGNGGGTRDVLLGFLDPTTPERSNHNVTRAMAGLKLI